MAASARTWSGMRASHVSVYVKLGFWRALLACITSCGPFVRLLVCAAGHQIIRGGDAKDKSSHLRQAHMASTHGKHTWQAHMASTHGKHTWQAHMASTHGKHTWQAHMASGA